jgi:hypothetical protein
MRAQSLFSRKAKSGVSRPANALQPTFSGSRDHRGGRQSIRQIFQPDNDVPTGYAADGVTLKFGGQQQKPLYDANGQINPQHSIYGDVAPAYDRSPAAYDATPDAGQVTGLTPARPAPTIPQADVNGDVPGVPVSTFAPSGQSQADVIKRINSGAPPPGSTQTESTNPLTGGKSPAPTGKTQTVSATPAAPIAPATPNSGGVITRGNGDFAQLNPDAGYKGPTATLSPDGSINHARALGYSSRGGAIPPSTDANAPTAANTSPMSIGGTGAFKRPFSNPLSAGIYHSYVKGLFGSQNDDDQPGPSSGLQRAYSGGQGALTA